jgi:hypothetical protein
MDQQSIVLYLSRKGLSAVAIHDNLVATLDAEAVSYPLSSRGDICLVQFAGPLPPRKHQVDDSGHAIRLPLADQPFASIRELS